MKTVLIVLLLIGAAAGGAAYYVEHSAVDPATVYRVATIRRGDVAPTISATGTLEAEDLINVGAQVAGLIIGFGKDVHGKAIDYNSVVEKDMELAYIDQKPYKAAVEQAQAMLDHAKADLLQYEAKAVQAAQEAKRAESLRPSKAIADTDYDTAVANSKVAVANVAVAKAAIKANQAALDVAQTNLDYTVIKSPVRGTIIDRRVNVGQTVVASLNAPSLFLIAKDLQRMQVWALVNEANIGRIYANMPVQFTVDAYPKDTFRGKVIQVRMNAQMTSNVVNYMVIVETDNSDGRLLTYMTATVSFEERKRTNVLVVPNAALRWKPKSEASLPTNNSKMGGRQCLWIVVKEGFPEPIPVELGPTDGTVTEVSGDNVKEGMCAVVGIQTANGDVGQETSGGEDKSNMPFMPKFPKKGPPKGPGGPPLG